MICSSPKDNLPSGTVIPKDDPVLVYPQTVTLAALAPMFPPLSGGCQRVYKRYASTLAYEGRIHFLVMGLCAKDLTCQTAQCGVQQTIAARGQDTSGNRRVKGKSERSQISQQLGSQAA